MQGGSPGAPGPKDTGPLANRAETARYIEEMAGELSHLARSSKLELLAYLLDMARLEARKNAN